MARVAIVAGLSIYLYADEGSHKEAHFHVRGRGVDVSINIYDLDEMRGELPRNKRKAILDFATRKRADLIAAIEKLSAGEEPDWIEG